MCVPLHLMHSSSNHENIITDHRKGLVITGLTGLVPGNFTPKGHDSVTTGRSSGINSAIGRYEVPGSIPRHYEIPESQTERYEGPG
jgi:hypothetical protein